MSGRNCGVDIPIGTVFTALCRRDFPVVAPGEAIVTPEAILVSRISLRLDAVEWYRRSIDAVPQGHTAMLTFSGDDFGVVVAALSAVPKNTYFSLCCPAAPMPGTQTPNLK